MQPQPCSRHRPTRFMARTCPWAAARRYQASAAVASPLSGRVRRADRDGRRLYCAQRAEGRPPPRADTRARRHSRTRSRPSLSRGNGRPCCTRRRRRRPPSDETRPAPPRHRASRPDLQAAGGRSAPAPPPVRIPPPPAPTAPRAPDRTRADAPGAQAASATGPRTAPRPSAAAAGARACSRGGGGCHLSSASDRGEGSTVRPGPGTTWFSTVEDQ